MSNAIHPAVNAENHHVKKMPKQFSEGAVLARRDTWTGDETSHWVVRDVESRDVAATDCGFRYELEELDGSQAMYISHGELQQIAARNELRW